VVKASPAVEILCMPSFILVPHRRRASKSGETSSKPLTFSGDFFQNFKKSATEYSIKNFIFRILAKKIAHYVTLLNFFSHPSFVIYFSTTPPIKLKLGQQIISGESLIANHLNQSL
jgi:hypothetical protein